MNKFEKIRKLFLSSVLATVLAINSVSLFADTIFLIHGDTLKGIVTEQYEDRVIVSVPGGEIGIYKNRILRIKFDEPEQNYLQLGDKYLEKKQFDKALQLYKRAVKANPNFQQAKDALLKLEDRKRAQAMERQKKEELLRKIREQAEITLENMLGIKILSGNKMEIYPNSPASKKGIQAGDRLVSIYNQLVKHMPLSKVYKYLIGSGTGEVKLAIERHIRITESGRLGIRIAIKRTGLTITEVVKNSLAERVGLKAGDMISAINGKSTRYMNMKQVVKNLKQRSAGQLSLAIRRNIVLNRIPVEETKVSVRTKTLKTKKKQKRANLISEKDIPISMLTIPGTKRKGLGIKIELVSDGITITDVTEGSAADIAELKTGDIITAIDKKSLKGVSMSDIIKTLREKKDSEFIMTVRKKVETGRDIVLNKVPVKKTKFPVRTKMLKTKKKQKGYLGLKLASNSAKIVSVVKNSPAEKSGLRSGDEIIEIAGKSVKNMGYDSFINKLKGPAGGEVRLIVEKDILIKMLIIPGTKRKGLGIKIELVSDGITITDVTEGSSADIAVLKTGDIIRAIDRKSLKGMSISEVIKTLKEKKNVEFTITVIKEIKIRRG